MAGAQGTAAVSGTSPTAAASTERSGPSSTLTPTCNPPTTATCSRAHAHMPIEVHPACPARLALISNHPQLAFTSADCCISSQSPSCTPSDTTSSPTTTTLPDITTATPTHDDDQGPPQPEHAAGGLISCDSLSPGYIPTLSTRQTKSLSLESIVPRQAMSDASDTGVRSRHSKPESLSLSSMMPARSAVDMQPSTSASPQRLANALSELARQTSNPPIGAHSLRSPCFYHNRFEDAVDFNRVLEEIQNDDWSSHSHLVRTATGVREVSRQLQRKPIRQAVRNVMIITKARDNDLVHLTRELATWLIKTPRYGSDIGVNVYVDAKLRHSKRFCASSITDDDPRFLSMLHYWTPDLCWSRPEKFDLVCTLGGDGTVLYTSWLFQRIVPPVISFSLGSLGFLTTFEFAKYKQHLNRIMGDEGMRVNLRMRFTCTVYRDGATEGETEKGEQFEVLNELVIDRGPSPYVSNLELYGNNEPLTVVQADGCIFSTPTGSTAYSLSAGGALVHPDIPAILLTPICPHTLSFRPMVLSDTMLLRVSVPHNSRATAYCAFDGKGRLELRPGDCVTIMASQYPFPTIMRTDTEWFDSVSRTLQWNTRVATQKGFESKSSQDASNKDDEEPEWDIDTDSAYHASEDGSIAASPLGRQMSLLGL